MSTKVLVFESDPAFAGELRNELGKLGCNTVVVDDGNVGLQQAGAEKPDLILLSIELPRMNGFSVCNKLKKDPNLKDVPLVIMSSESSDETFEQHKKLRTRAEDYVHKPIAFGELLQHIQTFVALGPPPSEGDAGIVIDDEIEIGSTDYTVDDDAGTQIAVRPPLNMLQPGAHPPPATDKVDDDVDAFADAAFGRLTGDPPGVVAEARPIHNNGSNDSVTGQVAARRASVVPSARNPSVRPGSMRPGGAGGVDPAEHEKLRGELEAVRARAADTETALRDARDEAEKFRMEAAETEQLRREVEELKTRLAAGPKAGGISSREFLDLREALNKKDKEILSLREGQSKKDREIVEGQDRLLALERTKADLEDKNLVLERSVAEGREKVEALTADKDLAKKAGEDLKARLEKSRAEGEAKDKQIADLRAKGVEDAASGEAKLAGARADFEQTLANDRAEAAEQHDEAEQRRKADLEQAGRDREAALADAKEQADREQQEALSAQSTTLKSEHDGKMAALHRAHQQELERLRNDANQSAREAQATHDAAFAAARKDGEESTEAARKQGEETTEAARKLGEETLAATRITLEKQGVEALASLRSEHAEKITSLENDRDSRVAALEAKAARELGDANERNAKADMDLSATRGELSDLREAKETGDATAAAKVADLEGKLAETISARDDLTRKLATSGDRVASLEAESASTRQELAETKQKLAGESARADRALAKWESDKQSLERAKDALAVVLSQIEEAEGRPIA
jgi:CheY-like chemotaxis protein